MASRRLGPNKMCTKWELVPVKQCNSSLETLVFGKKWQLHRGEGTSMTQKTQFEELYWAAVDQEQTRSGDNSPAESCHISTDLLDCYHQLSLQMLVTVSTAFQAEDFLL